MSMPPGRSRAARPAGEPPGLLFVDHASGLGGAEHSLLALLAALDRSRFRPVLATVPGPLAEAARALDMPVATLRLDRLRGRRLWPLPLARGVLGLLALVRRERVALLHANVLRAALYTAPAARLARRPWVWHVRDILTDAPSTRRLCREAAAVVAISRAVAGALPCPERARVIFNPVAPGAARLRDRAALGLPAGPLVASVGRLRAWKGHGRFLEAAARVRDPQARFLVLGGRVFREDETAPDLEGELRRQAERLGIAGRVTFTGQRGDLADIWPHLTLLVHCAEAEPFGRVVAEAQASGLPVVAFRDGGVPEIVADGATGLLVAPGDLDALAAAVDRLLADPELGRRLGAAGRERARRLFDPAAQTRAVEAVYAELLGPRRGHRASAGN